MANRKPIEFRGRSLTLEEWARELGIPSRTLSARIHTLGWPIERALTTPPDRRFRAGGRPRANAPRPCPAIREHANGQAYCRWQQHGRDVWRYFGKWGSAEAKVAYRRFQAEWAAGEPEAKYPAGQVVFVAEVALAWMSYCESTYTKRGKITSEVHANRSAWMVANDLYGDTPAEEFDARKLRIVRDAMIKKGWYRKTVNDQISRIVRSFAWAVTENLVPKSVHDVLSLVEPIVAGRTSAPERKKKTPVPVEQAESILPHLHPDPARRSILAAMVRLQILTGMRPGELCGLRPEDLDRNAEPWKYEVSDYNKMLHKEIRRTVFIGPQGREILRPFLAAATSGLPIFHYPTSAGSGPKTISVTRYRTRIKVACRIAGCPQWTPHRLRHTRATEVMARYESDSVAGAAIGDSPEVARQVYAHQAGEAVARRIAEEMG